MRRRRRVSNADAKTLHTSHIFKSLPCSGKNCTREVETDDNVVSVLCWECVQRLVGIDEKYLKQKSDVPVEKVDSGFPRGWHLYKVFVHADGRVFESGTENPKLRGTLPVTVYKVNNLSKSERRKARDEKKSKRESRLAKQYEKKMKMKEKLEQ